MFINLSNHPSTNWSEQQINAAKKIGGEIIDISFPNIDPHDSSSSIQVLALRYYDQIINLNPDAVMVSGEYTFTLRLYSMLRYHGVPTCVACTERKVEEIVHDGKTIKKSTFEFVQFRWA